MIGYVIHKRAILYHLSLHNTRKTEGKTKIEVSFCQIDETDLFSF